MDDDEQSRVSACKTAKKKPKSQRASPNERNIFEFGARRNVRDRFIVTTDLPIELETRKVINVASYLRFSC